MKDWVDYSSKFGLGYALSNGKCGFYFNDATKMIINPGNSTVQYMERIPQKKEDSVKKYDMKDIPQDLQKKLSLLKKFKLY